MLKFYETLVLLNNFINVKVFNFERHKNFLYVLI